MSQEATLYSPVPGHLLPQEPLDLAKGIVILAHPRRTGCVWGPRQRVLSESIVLPPKSSLPRVPGSKFHPVRPKGMAGRQLGFIDTHSGPVV